MADGLFRRPLVFACAGFAGGTAFAFAAFAFTEATPSGRLSILLAGVGIGCAGVATWRKQARAGWVFAAFLLWGAARGTWDEARYRASGWPPELGGTTIAVEGTVLSPIEEDGSYRRVWLRVERRGETSCNGTRVRVGFPERSPSRAPALWPGDRIEVTGRFDAPSLQANPGGFDPAFYHRVQESQGTLTLPEPSAVQVLGRGPAYLPRNLAARLRADIVARFDAAFGARRELAALLSGLVLGGGRRLSDEVTTSLRDTGLIWIVVVAGLHVAMVLGAFWMALNVLRVPRRVSALLLLLVAATYAFVCGLSAPVVRASLMISFALVALLFDRDPDPLSSLAGSALLVLGIQPAALLELSFQLSFVCAAAMIVLIPILQTVIPLPWESARSLVAGTIAAQIGVAPLLIYHFANLPLIAVVANLVAIPLLSALLGLGLLLMVFLPISQALASPFLECAALLLRGLLHWSRWLARLPGATLHPPSPSAVTMILLLGTVLFWLASRITPDVWRRTLRWGAIGFAAAGIGVETVPVGARPAASLAFFSVGQGDATFAEWRSGFRMLVDGGPSWPRNQGESTIVPWLRKTGRARLDAVVCTHAHADHVGGLAAVLRDVPVSLLVDSGQTAPDSRPWRAYRDEIGRAGKTRIVRDGDRMEGIPDGSIRFLWPRDPILVGTRSDPNNDSIVSVAEVGEGSGSFRIVLTGDVEEEALALLESAGGLPAAAILKVPHHGSASAAPERVAAMVRPSVAVACVGSRNRFGFPAPETVVAYERAGAAFFQTDRDGCVLCRVYPSPPAGWETGGRPAVRRFRTGSWGVEVEPWMPRDGRFTLRERWRRAFWPLRKIV